MPWGRLWCESIGGTELGSVTTARLPVNTDTRGCEPNGSALSPQGEVVPCLAWMITLTLAAITYRRVENPIRDATMWAFRVDCSLGPGESFREVYWGSLPAVPGRSYDITS